MSDLGLIRNEFGALVAEYNSSHRAGELHQGTPINPLSPGQRGALNGALNRELGGDMNRKQFLKALTGHASSKDLTDAEWYALGKLLGFMADGSWSLTREGADLARKVLAEGVKRDGQIEMF